MSNEQLHDEHKGFDDVSRASEVRSVDLTWLDGVWGDLLGWVVVRDGLHAPAIDNRYHGRSCLNST